MKVLCVQPVYIQSKAKCFCHTTEQDYYLKVGDGVVWNIHVHIY